MTTELKPCDRCNGQARFISMSAYDYGCEDLIITCDKCKLSIKFYSSYHDNYSEVKEALFVAWNTRPLEDALNELENENTQLLQQFEYQTEEVKKLEAWQKEAGEMLSSLISTLEDQRCPHWHIKKIKELLKQAEDN